MIMKPVSAEELLYRIFCRHERVYDVLFDKLRLNGSEEDFEWLSVEDILGQVADIYPNFYMDIESIYYELLGWVTAENKRREELVEHQKELKNPQSNPEK